MKTQEVGGVFSKLRNSQKEILIEIKRKAARHGDDWKHFIPNGSFSSIETEFKWDDEKNTIVIVERFVPDPSDSSHEYDYVVTLNLNEIAELLKHVCEDGLTKSPNSIGPALKPLAVNLLRLVVAANDMKTSPLANEK